MERQTDSGGISQEKGLRETRQGEMRIAWGGVTQTEKEVAEESWYTEPVGRR